MRKNLEKAIKKEIEKEVIQAISETDISYYLNPKTIKLWVENVIKQLIAQKAQDLIERKIFSEFKKYDNQLDMEIKRLTFEEVSKHINL